MIEAQTLEVDLKKAHGQTIALNFLEFDLQQFEYTIYRKPYSDGPIETNSRDTDIRRYKLPSIPSSNDNEYEEFLISFEPQEGFEQFKCLSFFNHQLTCLFIYKCLLAKCKQVLVAEAYCEDRKFRHSIHFILSSDSYGKEFIWIEPYYLKSKKLFGLLLGFGFKKAEGQVLDRIVLQKSLSLDKSFRENRDFYADHYKKLEDFLSSHHNQIFPLALAPEIFCNTLWPPTQLEAHKLEPKTYIFKTNNSSNSQFMGIKQYGPYTPAPENSLICFMYRPQDKPYSHDLYYALRGDRYSIFPGMEKMFSFSLEKEHVTGIPLTGFDDNGIKNALEQIRPLAHNRTILPIVIFPWSRHDLSLEGRDTYYKFKHAFLSEKIPSQMVSLNKLQNKEALKWSTANIGLAVFSKLGGIPWKVKPEHNNCLIIGISQAHRKGANKQVNRYFAYSVLTDSSGIYKSINVLADSQNEADYLQGLVERLKETLKAYAQQYNKFVIHTSFTLKKKEMSALHAAVHSFNTEEAVEEDKVTVIKFNDTDKFFGFSLWHNSKVPYESSYIKLTDDEYLVWFEGLQYHDPTVKRRISRPMHIKFTYPLPTRGSIENKKYLQDALNLSGANWRGFNAKSLPVSVYYAKLIADYIGRFDELGLPEIDIENFQPWFL